MLMLQWESKQHKCWPLATHVPISSTWTTATVTTFAAAGKQSNNSYIQQQQCSQEPVQCVHKGCKQCKHNTYISIAIWAGTRSGCQHRAAPSIAWCPESSMFRCISYDKLIASSQALISWEKKKYWAAKICGVSYDMRAWGQG